MQGHFYTNTTSPFADITAHVRERSRVVRHLHLRLTSTFACTMFSGNSFTFELTHWNVCSLCGRWNTCLDTIKRIFQRFRQQSESCLPLRGEAMWNIWQSQTYRARITELYSPSHLFLLNPSKPLTAPSGVSHSLLAPLFSSSVSRILTIITTTTFARKLKYTSVCWKNNNSVMIIIITRRLIDPRRRIVSFFILTPRGQRSEVRGRGAVPRCRILQ